VPVIVAVCDVVLETRVSPVHSVPRVGTSSTGRMTQNAYVQYQYGYNPPSPNLSGGLRTYNAAWSAIMRMAKSDTSIARAGKKPDA
jgi:hypothetical protein